MARMLKQKGTNRLYKWHAQLAERGDMVEVEHDLESDPLRRKGGTFVRASVDDAEQAAAEAGEGEPKQEPEPAQKPEPATDTEGFDNTSIVVDGETYPISNLSRSVIAEYAERHFGESLDRRKSAKVLTGELQALIEQHGHPDADE